MPEKVQAIKEVQDSQKLQAAQTLAETYDKSIAEIEGHIQTYQQKAEAERTANNDILVKAYEETVKSLSTVKESMLSKKALGLDDLLKKQAEDDASKDTTVQPITDVVEQDADKNVSATPMGGKEDASNVTTDVQEDEAILDDAAQKLAQGKKKEDVTPTVTDTTVADTTVTQTPEKITAATKEKTQKEDATTKIQAVKTDLQKKVDEILNVLTNELGIEALKWGGNDDDDDDDKEDVLDKMKKKEDDLEKEVVKTEKSTAVNGIDLAHLLRVFKKEVCITDLGKPAYDEAFREWKLRDVSATERSNSQDVAALRNNRTLLQRFPFLKDASESNDANNFTQAYLLNLWYEELAHKEAIENSKKAKDNKKKTSSKYKSREDSSEVEKFRVQAGIAYSFFPGGFNFDNDFMTPTNKEAKRMEHLVTLHSMLDKLKAENDKSALKDDSTTRKELGDVVYTFQNVDYARTNFPIPKDNTMVSKSDAAQDTNTKAGPITFAQVKETLMARAKNTLSKAKDDAAYTFKKFKTEASAEKEKAKNWLTRQPKAYQPRQK